MPAKKPIKVSRQVLAGARGLLAFAEEQAP
jgi:hypothetical protein